MTENKDGFAPGSLITVTNYTVTASGKCDWPNGLLVEVNLADAVVTASSEPLPKVPYLFALHSAE